MIEYVLAQYRTGSRFVVFAYESHRAGSVVVFGPDTREACEAFIKAKQEA